MLHKPDHRWAKKLIALSICAGVVLSGCGKQAENVTDYGKTSNTGKNGKNTINDPSITEEDNASDSTEKNTASETGEWRSESEITDAINGHKLSDWLGGNSLTWNNNFAVDSVPVEVNFAVGIAANFEDVEKQYQKEPSCVILWDTYELPAWRVTRATRDNVNEEIIVQNLFGNSAKRVEREISLESGDAKGIIDVCRRCQIIVDQSENPGNPAYSFDSQEVFAEKDGEDYFWHTYEGPYLGFNYQLTVGYLGSVHEKVLAFYPKNLGDPVGAPQISHVVPAKNHQLIISQQDTFYLKDLDELSIGKNRSTKNEETLCKEAEDFLRDQLLCRLWNGEVITHNNNERPSDLVFITEEDVWDEFPDDGVISEELSGAVVDGYLVNLDTSIGNQRFPSDNAIEANNKGTLWITDKGVIGGTLYIAYDYEECLTEQVAILPFEQATGSMELVITQNLDVSKVKGATLKLEDLQFVYYAYPSPADSNLFTLIPVWKVTVVSGYSTICTITMNAISGRLIEIKYTK